MVKVPSLPWAPPWDPPTFRRNALPPEREASFVKRSSSMGATAWLHDDATLPHEWLRLVATKLLETKVTSEWLAADGTLLCRIAQSRLA